MNARDDAATVDLGRMSPAEAASYWLVRQDSPSFSADEQQALQVWLAASLEHRQAFQRGLETWNILGEHADSAQLRSIRAEARASGPERQIGLRVAAVAIAVVACLSTLALITSAGLRGELRAWLTKEPVTVGPLGASGYATARSERSTVTLSDGTVVSMNLDTALEVEFGGDSREVRITRGQAFFAVAKDMQRPFIVEAAGHRIRALGTEFDVRLDSDRLEVVLLEGRIMVDRVPASLFDSIRSRGQSVELVPGQRLVAGADNPPLVTSTDAVRDTSWREGWIAFEDEQLATAAATLNRYSTRQIVIADESVRALRVSGVFRIDQPEQFGVLIQELLPVRVAHDAQNYLLVLPKERIEVRPR